ncbi:head-tail connector protein [Peribacillus loiseleuriae]|uniref:head-tail connector protein n=1 Tax=Peribacillus loiseleuriae TaxID=1679170 RepID=UPI00380F5E6D
MILELEETKDWLRVDGNEEDSTILLLIGASEEYLKNATGRVFDFTNNQARLFCLVLVTDWYENRDLIGVKVSEKVRYSIQSMLAQLQYMPEGDNTSG